MIFRRNFNLDELHASKAREQREIPYKHHRVRRKYHRAFRYQFRVILSLKKFSEECRFGMVRTRPEKKGRQWPLENFSRPTKYRSKSAGSR